MNSLYEPVVGRSTQPQARGRSTFENKVLSKAISHSSLIAFSSHMTFVNGPMVSVQRPPISRSHQSGCGNKPALSRSKVDRRVWCRAGRLTRSQRNAVQYRRCLLYTSDAADD